METLTPTGSHPYKATKAIDPGGVADAATVTLRLRRCDYDTATIAATITATITATIAATITATITATIATTVRDSIHFP